MAVIKSELIDAQIENVAVLPTFGKKGRLVYLTIDGRIYKDDVTSWTPINGLEIQDYTAVGSVGSANQQFAGRDYTLAELQTYFTAPKVISYYRFGAGAALGTDDVGTYSYTLGAAGKAPSNGTGIMGTAFAISFDGGDYATNATKFDDMTTTFSGAGKGLIHSFWLSAPADGQPAAQAVIYNKTNSAANDVYMFIFNTDGTLYLFTRGNSVTAKSCKAITTLPNGVNTNWYHVVCVWNTTNGLQLYINGKLEAQDSSATTLMVDGTTTDFFIGGSDTTPANPYNGLIANEVVVNDVCTQAMVDFLYATTIPLPATLQGQDFMVRGLYKNLGVATDIRQYEPKVIQVRSTDLLMEGGSTGMNWQSTDTRRIIGRV